MDGAIYVLSRDVNGDTGQKYTQTVAVFAGSPTEARGIVSREFASIRRNSRSPERPYAETPDWRIDRVDLDESKVISSVITG